MLSWSHFSLPNCNYFSGFQASGSEKIKMFWLVHVFCFISRPMDEWKMRKASDKVAESLLKPQKNEVSESEVIQTNKGYDVFISYCHQNKAHADKLLTTLRFLTVLISYFTLLIVLFLIYFIYNNLCFVSDFPILKDETELDLIGFIFANKKMLYFTSFSNFIQIFFHLSRSQWYFLYGKKFS